jgi:hypothetical protein
MHIKHVFFFDYSRSEPPHVPASALRDNTIWPQEFKSFGRN